VALPEVPTIAEAAVPGYEAIEWNGAMVPAGTPAAAINRLHQAIAKSVAIPEVKERVTALGADLAATSPDEFAAFVRKELATWSKVVKEVGIRIQ
jgi:tripartite-type tricarboxylate transporter receptor subunit TctC